MIGARQAAAALAAFALAGCAVGPNYVRPAPQRATTSRFVEHAATPLVSEAPLAPDWWRMFDDPVLDRLIADAFAYNTDIRQAVANLRRARAAIAEQRAGLLPTTNLSGGYTRNRVGADSTTTGGGTGTGTTGGAGGGTGGVGGTTGGTGTTTGGTGVPLAGTPSHFDYNYYQAGIDASYEVDLFGRVSRSIEAARADAEATAAALDAARISIAGQVAQSYADACADAEQADVARETARLQGDTQRLTQRLLDAGRGTQRDVDRAVVLVEQAKAQVPAFEGERHAQLYALAVLTGRPPAEYDGLATQCRKVPKVRVAIPVGDGAALLARRPDVRQAERTLAGDTARIGIATADLFPKITLGGSASTGSTKAGHLGEGRSFGFSIGPLISWSFPNIVAAAAQLREARAGREGSLAAFEGTVLTALREAEQALARYAAALDRNAALRRATAAADDAAHLSRIRFDSGRDSFLDLLTSEQDRADARQNLAASDAAVADDQVALFKALGGGWENAPAIAAATIAAANKPAATLDASAAPQPMR